MPSLHPVPKDHPDAIRFARALHTEMALRYEDPDPCGAPGPLDLMRTGCLFSATPVN